MKASCVAVSGEAIAALRANSDAILGITWWGGGRIWPENYIFYSRPTKGHLVHRPPDRSCEEAWGGQRRTKGCSIRRSRSLIHDSSEDLLRQPMKDHSNAAVFIENVAVPPTVSQARM
jgi:hypothetical protein